MFEQRFNQAQSTSNPLLPGEQVLWEGYKKKSYLAVWVLLALQLILFIGTMVAVFDMGIFALLFIFVLFLIICVPINLLVKSSMAKEKTHYILTSERLIIKSMGSQKVTVNANFSQMLNIEYKSPDYNPYIKITSPYGELPSTYRPAQGVQQFHQKLYQLWRVYWENASPDEKAQLEHLYNPPMRPWIKFTSVFLATYFIPFVFLFILTKITGIKLLSSIGVILVSLIGIGIRIPLQTIILGKEYKLSLTVSPRHARVTLALSLIFAAPLFLMLIIFG